MIFIHLEYQLRLAIRKWIHSNSGKFRWQQDRSVMKRAWEYKMSDKILQLTDSSFESDVLMASGPVLVDFWAEWCGPCKMIAPILDELAEEYQGRITFCKLNVDQNDETPKQFGIRGIPTLLLFKNGNVAATKVGSLSKSQLIEFLDANI